MKHHAEEIVLATNAGLVASALVLVFLLSGCTVSRYYTDCYRDGKLVYSGPAVRQLVGSEGVAVYDSTGWRYIQAQCDVMVKG